MITKCEFQNCSWVGRLRDLVRHCDIQHPKFVREIDDDSDCVEFTLEELATNDFLLLGKHGLYWFLTGYNRGKDCIRRGVHAVAGSEICEYSVKFGELPIYLGPYRTSTMRRRRFDVKITCSQMELIGKLSTTNSVRLSFVNDKKPDEYSSSLGTYI